MVEIFKAHTMTFLTAITFFDLSMTLLALGLIERLLYLLPESVVGDGGWLLDTGPYTDPHPDAQD